MSDHDLMNMNNMNMGGANFMEGNFNNDGGNFRNNMDDDNIEITRCEK